MMYIIGFIMPAGLRCLRNPINCVVLLLSIPLWIDHFRSDPSASAISSSVRADPIAFFAFALPGMPLM